MFYLKHSFRSHLEFIEGFFMRNDCSCFNIDMIFKRNNTNKSILLPFKATNPLKQAGL